MPYAGGLGESYFWVGPCRDPWIENNGAGGLPPENDIVEVLSAKAVQNRLHNHELTL